EDGALEGSGIRGQHPGRDDASALDAERVVVEERGDSRFNERVRTIERRHLIRVDAPAAPLRRSRGEPEEVAQDERQGETAAEEQQVQREELRALHVQGV